MIEYCTIPKGKWKTFYDLWFKRAELRAEVEALEAKAGHSSSAPKRKARRRRTSWHG